MLRPLIERLIRQRWLLLSLAIVIGGLSVFFGQQLQFDRSIENMFSADDPLIEPYSKLKKTFGGNEVILGIYRDDNFLNQDRAGINRLRQVRSEVELLEGVSSVLSLDQLDGKFIDILGDSTPASRLRELFVGFTHSRSGTVVALPCLLVPESESNVPRAELVKQIHDIVIQQKDGMITGEPVMVVDGFRYVEEDGARLGWATSILLGLVIFIAFRSIRWVVISLAVVQFALWSTKALLVVVSFELSMVSSMLTAIVTVIGIATVVHILIRFREHRLLGKPPEDALAETLTYLSVPIFWACVTDAVGFCSLLVTSVGPVHDFGIMIAVGALMVIVSVALIVPALVLIGQGQDDPGKAWGEDRIDTQLQRMIDWIQHRPVSISVITVILLITAIYGSTKLEVESDFTKNFREDTDIVKAYKTVEDELGGAGVWDIMLPAPKLEKLDWAYIQAVLQFENRLREEVPGLTKVLSLADAMTASTEGTIYDLNNIPVESWRDKGVRTGMGMFKEKMPPIFNSLYASDIENSEQAWFRVMLRAEERQNATEKKKLIDTVTSIAKEFEPDSIKRIGVDTQKAKVTGFFVLLTNLIDSLIKDQWTSFMVAIAGIGVTMLLAFRSPVYAAVALVPNILPVLVVTGMIGLTGTPINMGAAMIAAVSMGLSVDSSIHYIIGFQRELRTGLTVQQALSNVQRNVGRAIVFATLALIVGFSVLCISSFVPTIYFGVLVSLAMLGGLAGNLVILPLLLKFVTREVPLASA
ncbi:MAG: efflux RND transporter permease subunit [Pirellulales bacterium]